MTCMERWEGRGWDLESSGAGGSTVTEPLAISCIVVTEETVGTNV